jgi:hypothetical protein
MKESIVGSAERAYLPDDIILARRDEALGATTAVGVQNR